MPETFLTHADGIRNLPLSSDDVFVVTYPRSGTTWTQELVWLVANDLDFEKAKSTLLQDRYPFLEYYMFFTPDKAELIKDNPEMRKVWEASSVPGAEILNKTPGRRFVKTHLPLSLLPTELLNTSKVVYVARDVRDVAVSCYHFYKANKITGIVCDFKTFYEQVFATDMITWSPYFEHIKEGWEQRNHPNMLFLRYEELSKDLKGVARRVSDFFGKSYSDQQLDQLCDHLKFDNFQKNKAIDLDDLKKLGLLDDAKNFVRQGKTGGWRDHFDENMTRHVENWINKELRGTALSFQ